jgi:saccharopine dehydrogenase-like NADP-dependent oxidoreductase
VGASRNNLSVFGEEKQGGSAVKVLFLGGAGDMGAAMVELMKQEDLITSVTIADLDGEKAASRAAEAGDKYSARALDLTKHDELAAAMREHDLVLSYAGPFYLNEAPAAEAAIEAGVSYISIADDYDSYLAVARLEDKARAAGVKIMSGFGNSPGLTQLLAKKGYRSMGAARKITVNWAAGAGEDVGASNLLHVLHLMTGETLQWRNGREAWVPCGRGRKFVDFPEPIGRIPVWYTGHAESVTLPRWLPGLEEVSVYGGVAPPFDFRLVIFVSRLGLTKTHERCRRLLKLMGPILPLLESKKYPKESVGLVEVSGSNAGEPCEFIATYSGPIAMITSKPCLQTIVWWARGVFDDLPGGVYPPERLIEDVDGFLAELQQREMRIGWTG